MPRDAKTGFWFEDLNVDNVVDGDEIKIYGAFRKITKIRKVIEEGVVFRRLWIENFKTQLALSAGMVVRKRIAVLNDEDSYRIIIERVPSETLGKPETRKIVCRAVLHFDNNVHRHLVDIVQDDDIDALHRKCKHIFVDTRGVLDPVSFKNFWEDAMKRYEQRLEADGI